MSDINTNRNLRRRYDPVRKAASDSLVLAGSWLKNGESQTPAQRIGHVMVSLIFIIAGLFMADGARACILEGDMFTAIVMLGTPSLFFLFFGVLGICNAFRFPKRKG